MPELTRSNTKAFLERFSSFNDAVIRKVVVTYNAGGTRSVEVIVGCRDNEAAGDGWVSVRLIVEQVGDFCIADDAKMSAQVISEGVYICWLDGAVGIDFGHLADTPVDLSELRTSRFFVIGNAAMWELYPY